MEQAFAILNALHPIPPEGIEYLKSVTQAAEFKPREFLLKGGRVSDRIHFIKEGLVRCFYIIDDKEVTTWFMKTNDLALSPGSFFTQTVSRESIQAIKKTSVFSISAHELEYCYTTFCGFERIGRLLGQKYQLFSEDRLYILHLPTAEKKYDYIIEHHPDLFLQTPHKYLASYLKISPQYLSDIKKR